MFDEKNHQSQDRAMARGGESSGGTPGRSTLAGNIITAAPETGVIQRKAASAPGTSIPSQRESISSLFGGATIWRKAVGELTAGDEASPSDLFEQATSGAGTEVPYRAEMERSFGQSFADVRAFTGQAAAMQGLGAEAATRGNRIAFADATPRKETVAHELTHVVQGRAHGTGGALQAKDAVSSPSHAAEHEADAVAARVVRGERVAVSAAPQAPLALRSTGSMLVDGKGAKIKLTPGGDALKPGKYKVVATKLTAEELRGLGPNDMVDVEVFVDILPLQGRVAARHLDREAFTDAAIRGGKSLLAAHSQIAKHAPKGPEGGKEVGNPDEAGGNANASFPRPRAIAVDGDNLIVEIHVHTLNRYDRIGWSYQMISSTGVRTAPEDRAWWNNPAWAKDAPKTPLDATPGADGPGTLSVRRTLHVPISLKALQAYFEKDGGLKASSMITFGMKLWYGGNGPTAATAKEYAEAYGQALRDHNWGYTRGDPQEGAVDLTPVAELLGLKADWMTDAEVWQMPLPDNPSPNKLKDFPVDYGKTNPAFAPLAPKGPVKLATRIENEATLKVSSGMRLASLIDQLSKSGGVINGIMNKGPEPLPVFDWTLAPEGEPMVFTDIYLDDPALHALTAGVGIRKRSSKTATKLNVKTGAGYQVGKLDEDQAETRGGDESTKSAIFRRHEIGFDIAPSTTGEEIGAFLASGLDHEGHATDPWNRAGEQANKTVHDQDHDAAIDFTQLRETMVLQGHRTKFKLQATPKVGGTPINIEISCDHTVGRTYEAFQEDAEPKDLFEDLTGKYKHAYNVELELEHLGAKAPPPEQSGGDAPSKSGGDGGLALDPMPKPKQAMKAIPPTHPGRMYMRDDTAAPQFNTPSFQVFYRAHEQLIDWMRGLVGSQEELGQDQQKLESIRDQLRKDGSLAPKAKGSGGVKSGPPPVKSGPPPVKSGPPPVKSEPPKSEPPKSEPPKSDAPPKSGALDPSKQSGPPSSQASSSDKGASSVLGKSGNGYNLGIAAKFQLSRLRVAEVPAAPDGDCFYASIIATANRSETIQELRNLVADELGEHPQKYTAFLLGASAQTVASQIRVMGSFAGQHGDLAVAILPQLLGLAVTIIQANNGAETPPQNAGTAITLIRFTGGGKSDHFHGTRRI